MTAHSAGGHSQAAPDAARGEAEHFDQVRLMARLGDDREVMYEALGIFLESAPGRIQQLRSVVGSDDTDTLAKLGHTIKGVGLTVSAPRLSALGVELEAQCRRADRSRLDAVVDDVCAEYERVCSLVEAWMSAHESEGTG